MKFARLKAALLTGVMALSLTTPAFAASNSKTEQSLKIGSTTRVPVISLQMPTNPAIVLNPYRLKVTIDKDKDLEQQIASPVMKVVNLSECPIQVGVKAQVKLGTGVALKATTTAGATATGDVNDVWINLSGMVNDGTKTKADLYTENASTHVVTATSTVPTKPITAADTDVELTDAANGDFSYTTVPTAKLNNTLVAGTGTKAGTTGNTTFSFIFWGDATTDKTWTEKATVTPTISFKFTPLGTMPTT